MEDPNEDEWRIQEFRPPDKGLRQIWNSGVHLGMKIALTSILVSAAPLALPPLVVLSALGAAFSLPSGFYIASYAAIDKITATLLASPQQPPYKHMCGFEQERAYSDDKVAEEDIGDVVIVDKLEQNGYVGEYTNQKEEHIASEGSGEIGVDVLGPQVSMEDSKCMVRFGDVELEELEKDAIGMIEAMKDNEGANETKDHELSKEKEEPSPGIASVTIKGTREAEEEASNIVVSAELGGENDVDVEQTEGVDVFGPQLGMGDSRLESDYGDVQPKEFEFDRETVVMIDDEHSMEKDQQVVSISSEILKGIEEAEEQIMSLAEEDILGNGVEAVVVSTEVGGQNDINVEQVDVVSIEDSMPKVKFGDVDPEELERETTGMIESIRDEGVSETKYPMHFMETEEPIPAASEVPKGYAYGGGEPLVVEEARMIELVKGQDGNETTSYELLIETEEEPDPSTNYLREAEETLLLGKVKSDEIEELEGSDRETKNHDEPLMKEASPSESNQDIESGSSPHLSAEKTPKLLQQVYRQEEVTSIADKQTADVLAACGRKIVVRVSKSGDSIASRGRGETLILKAGGISSSEMQDTYLDDARSKRPIEGVNNSEVSTWKQINALRTIVGYDAPPHVSCSEELRALYVFTGVEPPALFNELHEKLMFLMAVVGVKE